MRAATALLVSRLQQSCVCHERKREDRCRRFGLIDAVLHQRWRGRPPWGWWSFAAALKGEAGNHPESLRSRAVVVSVVGKLAAVSVAGVERRRRAQAIH